MHLNHTKEENVRQTAIYNLIFPKSQWKCSFRSKHSYKGNVKGILTHISLYSSKGKDITSKVGDEREHHVRSKVAVLWGRKDGPEGRGRKAEHSSATTRYVLFGGESIFPKSWKILKNNFIHINFDDRLGIWLLIAEYPVGAEHNTRYFLYIISLQ